MTALLINPERLGAMSDNERNWHVDGAANIVQSIRAHLMPSAEATASNDKIVYDVVK